MNLVLITQIRFNFYISVTAFIISNPAHLELTYVGCTLLYFTVTTTAAANINWTLTY